MKERKKAKNRRIRSGFIDISELLPFSAQVKEPEKRI